MRREAGPQGVKVSIIEPGGIRTNLVRQQLMDVEPAYAALGEEDRERYGYLYKGYLKMAGDSLRETASTPDEIAAVVVEALDSPEPRAAMSPARTPNTFSNQPRNVGPGS